MNRRKYDKNALVEASLLAAVICAFEKEVTDRYPIPVEKVHESLRDRFIEGDLNLEVVVQDAIHTKNE